MRRAGQAEQARERALDAVLSRVDIPLPDSLVNQEIELRRQSLDDRLRRSGSDREGYLDALGMTADDLDAEFDKDARRSVKAGFILDKLAADENLGVDQAELGAYVTEQAYRMGVPPDRLAKDLADRGQLGSAVADVLRSKSLSLIAERAKITDETGRGIDLAELTRPADAADTDEPDPDAVSDPADDESEA
jgi:trigger factor